MPELDYAFLADYVRNDASGVAHAIAAGIDTVHAPQVPTGRNLGLLARLTFTQGECGRPHRVEIYLRTTDGQELLKIEGVLEPAWDPTVPTGWPIGALLAVNFGAPFPDYGLYSIEIMIDDRSVKSLNLRVVPTGN
jgi:uncharacterized protein DUF6941